MSSSKTKLSAKWQLDAALLSRPVDLTALVTMSRSTPEAFAEDDTLQRLVTVLLNESNAKKSDKVSVVCRSVVGYCSVLLCVNSLLRYLIYLKFWLLGHEIGRVKYFGERRCWFQTSSGGGAKRPAGGERMV